MNLSFGSIYSGGVDGFSYAAHQLDIAIKWHVEANRKAHKYLRNNYTGGKIYSYDEYVGKRNLEWVNIIAGGDPCQPHSNAGLGLGAEDNRYRWPVMFRVISELRPDWVINENVIGSIGNMVLDQKILDLESIGYTTQAFTIPAVATNAYHQRNRVWLIGNANGERRSELLHTDFGAIYKESGKEYSLGASGNAFLQFEERFGEPAILPVSYGIPDHIFRLEATGNAVVSTIPLILLQAIKWIEKNS